MSVEEIASVKEGDEVTVVGDNWIILGATVSRVWSLGFDIRTTRPITYFWDQEGTKWLRGWGDDKVAELRAAFELSEDK